jgi:hypothetical protein
MRVRRVDIAPLSTIALLGLALVGRPQRAASQLPVTKPTATRYARLAAPGPVVANQLPDGTIAVRWRAMSGAATYQVTRSVPGTPQQIVANPTDTTYLDVNVQAGNTYYYVVAAIDSGGGVGIKSGSYPVVAKISATAGASSTGGGAGSLAAGGATGGSPPVGSTGGGATGSGATTGAALVAPTGIFVEDFAFPKVAIYWGFTQSGMSYRIDRGSMPYGGKAAPTWQPVATTPPLTCCSWSVVDSALAPLPGTYSVYRVSTVDPAAPSRASTPVVSPQVRVAPVSIWGVTQTMWLLQPPLLNNMTVKAGTSLGTITNAMSSDPAIVAVGANGSVIAKAPGVAYLITMQLYGDGHPILKGSRVTVTP